MLKKRLSEIFLTFLISVALQSLVDTDLIKLWQLDQDDVANFIHIWLTLLSAYYLYNYILQWSFKKREIHDKKQWVLALMTSSIITITFIIITDILFYKTYYQVDSLSNETTFFDFDIPVTIAVMILGSLYFYQRYHINAISLQSQQNKTSKTDERIEVTSLNEHVFIKVDNIEAIYIEHGVVWIISSDGGKYQSDYSLNELIKILNPENFFRINRQIISSRTAIKSFEKLPYQKLSVNLTDAVSIKKEIIISKYNAPAFKKWITNSA